VAARARARGFTLIEVTLTIVLIAIAGMGLAALMLIAARGEVLAIDIGDATDAGTLATDRITLELREMQAPASIGLKGMAPAAIDFLDPSGNEIQYYMSATSPGTLARLQNGGLEQPLADSVQNFSVVYRAADGTAATSSYLVTRIDFEFDVVRPQCTSHFGGQISPRSLNPATPAWREQ
jgi:hypothetical protein